VQIYLASLVRNSCTAEWVFRMLKSRILRRILNKSQVIFLKNNDPEFSNQHNSVSSMLCTYKCRFWSSTCRMGPNTTFSPCSQPMAMRESGSSKGYFLSFQTGFPYVARLALNWWSLCLSLLSARITGMHHYTLHKGHLDKS
jgi:hypothetical protein